MRELKVLIGKAMREWRRQAERSMGRAAPHAQPYPFQAQWDTIQTRLAQAACPAPTQVRREDYLALVDGIISCLAQHQNALGAIIDPYEGAEKQYSTPCYAFCAALLVKTGRRPELRAGALKALDHTLSSLIEQRAADDHGDFFTFYAVLAYELLRDLAPAETCRRWERQLRALRPARVYRDIYLPRRQKLHNWNAIAVAGEFLRHQVGATDMGFVEYYIGEQLPNFTPAGMYCDPSVPMIYDHFPRYFWAMMLQRGYAGAYQAQLETLLERGAQTSLLMQSPCGELPTGGRSKQHQWAEALQCVTFELWAARRHQAGDSVAAAAFKRGAHLSLQALRQWVRPSGDLWIVKNRHTPEQRHGFEFYSFHTTYNLLAASMLALAYQVADDAITEGHAPCELGGYLLDIPAFHKVIANAGGHYIELDVCADKHYESTGLIRVHRTGVHPLVGPSDVGRASAETTWWDGRQWRSRASLGPPACPSSFGVAWQEQGVWRSLADYGQGDPLSATLELLQASPDFVHFQLIYSLRREQRPITVVERYQLRPDQLLVTVTVRAQEQLKLRIPVFASDGRDEACIECDGARLLVHFSASTQQIRVIEPEVAFQLGEERIPFRNGYLRLAEAVVSGDSVTYSLSPRVRGQAE